jgi:hypothetical protein
VDRRREAITFLMQDAIFFLAGVRGRSERATRAGATLHRLRSSLEAKRASAPVVEAVARMARRADEISSELSAKAAAFEDNLARLKGMLRERTRRVRKGKGRAR